MIGLTFVHFVLVGVFSLLIITLSVGMYRGILLKDLQRYTKPTKSNINFYRQCKIVSNILKLYEVDMTSTVLCTAFVSCLIFSNIFVIGFRRLMVLFLVPGLTVLYGFIFLLNILFMIGCTFYKSSVKTLSNWSRTTRRQSIFMRKEIKSLPIIAIPAGNVGIIDVAIKVNYFYSLLLNTTNSLLTVRSVFNL